MGLPEFSIVLPVYNEAENIVAELRAIERDVAGDFEVLIVYDFEEDTTLPAVRAMNPPVSNVRLVRNDLGRGVVNAIRKGFQASRGWLGVVVTMADLSDPPERIPAVVREMRSGCDVVAGSRYMRGGRQVGGPLLKRVLSRVAGLSAYWLSGVGIHDVTTNFRGYSRRLVESVPIESKGGFELGLELTVKCHLKGWRVGETPSAWYDRSAGESRFRLWKWLPGYLGWYLKLLFGDPFGLSPRLRRARAERAKPGDYKFFCVVDKPNYGWTANRYTRACTIVPRTTDGKFVMVRLRRPCFDPSEAYWELPGGFIDAGETALQAATRELKEETGYTTTAPGESLGPSLEPIPGMGTSPHDLVELRDCSPGAATADHQEEGIAGVGAFAPEEINEIILRGEIRSMVTLAAIARHRSQRPEDWS